MDFVETIYKATNGFPPEELQELTNQLRRAAVYIASNIADGAARSFKKEFVQFLHMALGAVSEVERQLIIAKRLRYEDDVNGLNEELATIRKLTLGLIRYLKDESKEG